jgi:hypothetical protein
MIHQREGWGLVLGVCRGAWSSTTTSLIISTISYHSIIIDNGGGLQVGKGEEDSDWGTYDTHSLDIANSIGPMVFKV